MRARGAIVAIVALAASCTRASPAPAPSPCPFRCVLRADARDVACPAPRDADVRWRPPSVPSESSAIVQASARDDHGRLVVTIDLRGGFVDAVDQNLYVFVGRVADARAGEGWSLSDDPAFFEDLGYPVRSRVDLPGPPLRRVAILSPHVEGYSPQVYDRARGPAALVGRDAGIALDARGATFEASIDLARVLGPDAAGDLWITVASARDYVGFLSDATIARVKRDGTTASARPTAPPMEYPRLDPKTHELASVSLARSGAAITLTARTAAPIADWAQTNASLYFFELPTPLLASRPRDAANAFELPAGWSYYCAVYSPKRVFCRRPDPSGAWTYDVAYAERPKLETPPGVDVAVEGDALRVAIDGARVGALAGKDVGVAIAIGRDGFAPTGVYGLDTVTVSPSDKRGLCYR